MKDIKLEQSLTIQSAFTTMEPTPSNPMMQREAIHDNILQNICPILVPESRINDDIVSMRIEGMEDVRVVFLIKGENTFLTRTAQMKYRIARCSIVEAINRNPYKYTFSTMSEAVGLPCVHGELPMYVLTNPKMHYGSGLIMSKPILRNILDRINEDIYILPSSVHELIILPASFVNDAKYLTDMVHSVNLSSVEPRDRLSNSVYKVDYTTMKMITIPYRP